MRTLGLFLIPLLLLAACDTPLGHLESHDHNGDGIEDHAPEEHGEHEEQAHEEPQEGRGLGTPR